MEKIKVIIANLLAMSVLFGLIFTAKCYGICFDLEIIGESTVKEMENIQLEAVFAVGNDLGEPYGRIMEKYVTEEATWISSNEDVVVVENGSVYGVQKGTATITAIYDDGGLVREASIEIEVLEDNKGYDPNDPRYSPISPRIYLGLDDTCYFGEENEEEPIEFEEDEEENESQPTLIDDFVEVEPEESNDDNVEEVTSEDSERTSNTIDIQHLFGLLFRRNRFHF